MFIRSLTQQGAGMAFRMGMRHPTVFAAAIPVGGWFELAEVITAAGESPDTPAVVLRAEGRGFNAGVDIKEMQATEGFDALLGANRGCFEAFKAVYESPHRSARCLRRVL